MVPDPNTPATTAFTGFDIPRQNWFKMPSNWTDITAEIGSIAELKVVEYVLKHTWGFQEYGVRKRITNDEFMHGRRRKDGTRIDKGTGLSKPSVIAGLKSAVERGLLIEEIDDSDKARVKKYYSLRMMPGLDDEFVETDDEPPRSPDSGMDGGGVKDLNAGVKNLYPEVKNLYPRGKKSLPRTEKDTLERYLQEETSYNNNSSANATKSDVVVALSSREIANQEQAHQPTSITGESPDPTPLPPSPTGLADANAIEQPLDVDPKADVTAALLAIGLAESTVQRLIGRYNVERISEKIEFLAYLQENAPERAKNPRGWLRRAIEENYGAPDGYKSAAEQAAEAATAHHRFGELTSSRQADMQRVNAAWERQRQEERARKEQEDEAYLAMLQQEYGTTQRELDIWQQVLAELALSTPSATFNTWLADSLLLSFAQGEALVGLVNPAGRDWVENRMAKQIERILASIRREPKAKLKIIMLPPRNGQNMATLAGASLP